MIVTISFSVHLLKRNKKQNACCLNKIERKKAKKKKKLNCQRVFFFLEYYLKYTPLSNNFGWHHYYIAAEDQNSKVSFEMSIELPISYYNLFFFSSLFEYCTCSSVKGNIGKSNARIQLLFV